MSGPGHSPSTVSSRTHVAVRDTDVPSPPSTETSPVPDDTDGWEHDHNNPRNWPPLKKWTTTSIVSLYTFMAPLGSSMMASGLLDIAVKYDVTNATILALALSIFLLSYAIGPLFLGPLSEMYGRAWILHISNLLFLCFNLGCALAPDINSFIAFRFLCGFAGSAPITIGGGCISDLFAEKDRAIAMAIYAFAPLIGPAIGPVIGGFIAESTGIQYVFYLLAALCGVATLFSIPLLRETYAPVIRRRLRARGADPEKGATATSGQNRWGYFWENLKRPIILLTRSFICFILSLYMALLYGIYFLMFATFPALFSEVYHFNVGLSGLAYLGLGFGFLAATITGAKISGKIYNQMAARNGGQGKPEMRIPALILGSFFVPVGLFWYGWSAQAKLHWIMPIIGTAIFGFGLMSAFLPIQLYLIDTFAYSASALAANALFRSLIGFAFPLFGQQMYNALGYGGGNSLLAGLAIIFGIPFPIWIYFYGERMRARSPLTS